MLFTYFYTFFFFFNDTATTEIYTLSLHDALPIGAVSFALKVSDPEAFRSGRHFAASLGLTPKENSTAGRHRPGRISRQGDESLRRLLVLGATAVIRFAKVGQASPWLLSLL